MARSQQKHRNHPPNIIIMKNLVVFIILLLTVFGSKAQVVVQETANVKKPAEGKLYYAKKDKTLYLFTDKFIAISTPTTSTPTVLPVATPISGAEEITLGYWAVPERVLVAKLLGGQYHLMQTNASRGFYVPRGKNLLSNHETKLSAVSLPNIASTNSDLGGLYPPSSFTANLLTDLGFSKNTDGEFSKGGIVVDIPPSNDQEINLGYWAASERLLIAKLIGGKYYLMQTNSTRSYYVPRGINLLNHHDTKLNATVLPNMVSQNSDLGGLYPAPNFPEAEFLKLGFSKNAQGEYVK